MDYKEKIVEMKTDLKQMGADIKAGRIEMKSLFKNDQPMTGGGMMCDLMSQSEDARYLHVAYGLARNKPYHSIEQKVRDGNKIRRYAVYMVLKKYFGDQFTEKDIEEWLEK